MGAGADSEAAGRIMDGSAWRDFCRALERAGEAVIGAAPDDAFDRAEGLRYVSRLATHALVSCVERSDPAAPVLSESSPKIGGDNPDYVYGGATLSGRYAYRLRGRRGDEVRLGIGTYYGALGTPQGLQCSGYLTSEALSVDPDGRFEIHISCDEPAAAGNWLPMRPETNQLTIRQTLLRRREQQPARFELSRLDAGPGPQPLEAERFAGQLGRAGGMVEGIVRQFLGWTAAFAARPNEIHPIDPALLAFASGDPATRYSNGYFELGPDEALVIDLDPPACDYWNLQVANHWLESLDFMHHTTHYNHDTVTANADGSVRLVVAREDPGVANWIDTAGHARGCIAMRFVGADRDEIARTRVVKRGDLA
jgi:hypothetical protein